MSKYQNKYRVESTRLQNWNYGWDGAYFITICTKEREHYFGNISDNKMKLSSIGILADVFWHEIKNHAKNIILDEFVVIVITSYSIHYTKLYDMPVWSLSKFEPTTHCLQQQNLITKILTTSFLNRYV